MIAYFDCFSGIAGDMVLGALVDCGLPWNHLTRELKKLKLTGYKINKEVALRKGIRGVSITVDGGKSNEEFSYKEIIQLIESSKLKSDTKDIASDIFTALGMAESKVHGCNLADVHFHEVGAIDSIVDIVGAAIGFEYFNFDKVYSSPLPVTRGFVKCRHGKFPVPPPAVLELIKGVPLQKSSVKAEIVTPTGAAIITTLADGFGENPIYSLKSVGYGQGDRNFKEIPNSLRLMIGEGYPVWIVETNIDDMNPQIYDYVSDKLFRAGAVDVALIPIQMKKNRPATLLQVQVPDDFRDKIIGIILKETTSLGVRYYPVERKIYQRNLETVKTKHGSIRVKIAHDKNVFIKVIPEYEDCKRIAKKKNIPLMKVYNEVNSKFGNIKK